MADETGNGSNQDLAYAHKLPILYICLPNAQKCPMHSPDQDFL